MTGFVFSMKYFVLNMFRFVLYVTEFALSRTGLGPKYERICAKYDFPNPKYE